MEPLFNGGLLTGSGGTGPIFVSGPNGASYSSSCPIATLSTHSYNKTNVQQCKSFLDSKIHKKLHSVRDTIQAQAPSSMRSIAMQCSKPLLIIYHIGCLYRHCDFYIRIRLRYSNRTVTLLQQSAKYSVMVNKSVWHRV